MNNRTLVVVSLPFQRLIRSHFSTELLNTVLEEADLAVVSPFAENPDFLKIHKDLPIKHIIAPSPKSLPSLYKFLFNVSSVMRVRGYWH